MTFPRGMIEKGLGSDAVSKVLGTDEDAPISVDQVRQIARLSRRRFWLCGDWIREQPLSVSDVTARRLTAVEALDLIGPVGLDEVSAKTSFNVKWRDRGWGLAPTH
jgi:hypothetical protein